MTPEERAEKILSMVKECGYGADGLPEFIAAEIRAAVEEAKAELLKKVCFCGEGDKGLDTTDCDVHGDKSIAIAKAEAYADAAKIAEETYGEGDYGVEGWFTIIADKIRDRAAEVGK